MPNEVDIEPIPSYVGSETPRRAIQTCGQTDIGENPSGDTNGIQGHSRVHTPMQYVSRHTRPYIYQYPKQRTGERRVTMSDNTVYENTDWSLVSSVKASKRRTQILKTLQEQPKMNGEIADELDVSTEWIRRQMKWLEDHDLVEDLTEAKTNYKLYRASEKGEEMVELL